MRVMLYAQPGHGRRSNLYTDYTFGVWQASELVPVAKAYSGLSNAEIGELDRLDSRAHAGEIRARARGRADAGIRAGL